VALERGEHDRVSHHLGDLIGLGTAGLENRQEVPDTALLYYTGLLGLQTRPAAALEQLLNDYFGVPVEIEQFVGSWHRIDPQHQCRLGEDTRFAGELGSGALLGERIRDEQSRVRVRLGPLGLEEYRDFLPGGEAHRKLKSILAFYAGMEFDMEAELVLRREDVPECELGTEGKAGPQLGWTTWVKSEPLRRDPSDTVLQLQEAI
jgi:type VI secretion system protein ImpH